MVEMVETTDQTRVAAVVTLIELLTVESPAFLTEQIVKLQIAAAKFPGFWSGEIIAPNGAHRSSWELVQRFSNKDLAQSWRDSAVRVQLLEALSGSDTHGQLKISDRISQDCEAEVATAIVTDLKPGSEALFFAWSEKIQTAQARRRGYRGSYMQPPPPDREGVWASVLRFNSPAALNEWFASSERKTLVDEAQFFVRACHIHKVPTSYPGWFPHDELTGEAPVLWKTALLVLMGIFPIVCLELLFLIPHLKEFPFPVRMLISLSISVGCTTYITMPIFIKAFKWWLFPDKKRAMQLQLTGVALIVGVFALQIAALWQAKP